MIPSTIIFVGAWDNLAQLYDNHDHGGTIEFYHKLYTVNGFALFTFQKLRIPN
jgi:hypothetical protein